MSLFDPALLDLEAVFAGFFADLGASGLAGVVFGIAVAADAASDAAEVGEATEHRFIETLGKPTVGLQILALSLLASMIGGAVAGWMAPEGAALSNAFAVGLLSTVISAMTLFFDPPTPPWVSWTDIILSLPGALLGGWLVSL